MEISFNISRENLSALKAAFEGDLLVMEAAAQEVRDNIARIDRALYPVSFQFIASEYQSGVVYKVTKTYVAGFAPGSVTYECECPSFKYNRGLDDRSRCKHIRKAQDRGL